ncbi:MULTISPECIES: hypothetical protein [Streptomyces]|uniref:Uncharacterized protein n=2 Tax=Streptomyces TaxID=1883 RepID=A0A2N8PGJ0_STRNR|nr:MULTISPECIES: hypothetical protein [Streptomyces]PNE40106.1 hypothetical protein AOB60_03525 [Streptomyces noursei]SHL35719.1 hypothetical protein SAMN05216268_10435 [Streptomyces yunnanensis]
MPQPLTINTPSNVVEGQSLTLSWVGGQGPYSLNVMPGGAPSGSPLKELNDGEPIDGESFMWDVDIPANTYVGLTLQDVNGFVAQSAPFVINQG